MANKLTSGDISEITRQSDVVSKPVRDNFTNIKNKVNEVIDDLSAVSIGTTNAETTAARPYHTNLKERLDNKNITPSGGVVTVNADTSKVDITQWIGTIEGIDVKVSAVTSSSVSASAASNHRVDVVVAQTDNSFVIVAGPESLKASTDPIFPSIATTQYMLSVLYVDDTGSVDLTGNIYALRHHNNLPSYYIKQATTLNQGRYTFNNLIIDGALTVDCTGSTGMQIIQRENILIKCSGNFHTSSNGTIGIAGTHSITGNADEGNNATIGVGRNCGGGGAASLVAGGGAGGFGDTGTAGTASSAGYSTSNSTLKPISFSAGRGGAGANSTSSNSAPNDIKPLIAIRAYNIDIDANIDNDGVVGNDGSTGAPNGSGGSGGCSGGVLVFIAENDFNNSATVTANGGNGGDANQTGGDGGGGGGAGGGLIVIRSLSYTNSGNITATKGAGGTGYGTGSNGSDGTDGIVDQALYGISNSDITDNYMPLNILWMEV